MRKAFGIGLVVILNLSIWASVAGAQAPGRWPVVVGEAVCAGDPAHPRGGLNWRVSCEAACPSGTSLLTGACRAIATDNQGLALESFGPTANGWMCRYVATRHDIDRSAGVTNRNSIKAEAHCRDHSPNPPGRWTTPAEGALMVIARSGPEIGERIRFGVRLCNTDGPLPVNVHLLLRDPDRPDVPQRPAPRAVPVGSCLQVDGPVAVFVQNGATQQRGLAGTYQIYREGTFKSSPEVKTISELAASQRDERAIERRAVRAGPAEPVRAVCEKIENAPKGLWGKCSIGQIAEQANYRICFGPAYAPPVNAEPSFPGDRLPMIVNPRRLTEPPPVDYFTDKPGGRDALNPVYANSCRDYLNVRDVNFLLLDDKSFPPAEAREVWFTLQKLG
jgi:hypothetical protein